MSMYIQSFVSASDCANKINDMMIAEEVNSHSELKAKALKDEGPRGFYVAIEVLTSEEYLPAGIMRQIADLASPILAEYTDYNQELIFYRLNRDQFIAKLSDVRGKTPAPAL